MTSNYWCSNCGEERNFRDQQDRDIAYQTHIQNCSWKTKAENYLGTLTSDERSYIKGLFAYFGSFKTMEEYLKNDKDISEHNGNYPVSQEEKEIFIQLRAKYRDNSSLCQSCQSFLSDLKAEPWEKAKLRCKSEAKYCLHKSNGLFTFLNKDKKPLIEKNTKFFIDGHWCLSAELHSKSKKYSDKCQQHPNCIHWVNDWNDEEHKEQREQPDQPNNPTINLLNQLEALFIQFNINVVRMVNNKLVVEFNNNNPTNSMPGTQQQQQITDYLTRTNKSKLSLEEIRVEREREREREREEKSTNYTPWIIGGGAVLVIILLLGLFLTKNSKKRK